MYTVQKKQMYIINYKEKGKARWLLLALVRAKFEDFRQS